jgi:hypothetical protein
MASMTKNLEKAFAEVSKLSEREQDAVAAWILAELASERAWDKTLGDSRQRLAQLGADAVREHREGRTERLDPEKL